MVGYAFYKKGLPGPVEVIRYDNPLDEEQLNALVDHLEEKYHYADLQVRLMKQSELEEWIRKADNT
jgi:hypothetical protein